MSDYKFLMEIKLTPLQFEAVNYISRAAYNAGVTLYLAGGAVRDLTAGLSGVRNLDFIVEGNLQRLVQALEPDRRRKTEPVSGSAQEGPARLDQIRLDSRGLTASAVFSQQVRVEISQSHKELRTQLGRSAEIVPAPIFEDLRRRDFSANAMAISLHPNSRGLLLDPTNGAADIENHELRALDSRGFLFDPSRIYRAIRLSDRLGFRLEPRTQDWLKAAIDAGAWRSMTPPQQGRELRAVLREDHPARMLRLFDRHGLLSGLDANLTAGKIPFERLDKIRSIAKTMPQTDMLPVMAHALAERLSPSNRVQLLKKIIVDQELLRTALGLEAEARKLASALSARKMDAPSAAHQLLSRTPLVILLHILAHDPKAKLQNQIKRFLYKDPQIRSKLPRSELQSLGIEPGPRAEAILEKIFLLMLDGKIKSPSQISKTLQQYAAHQNDRPKKMRSVRLKPAKLTGHAAAKR